MNPAKWFLVIFILYIAGYTAHSVYLGKTPAVLLTHAFFRSNGYEFPYQFFAGLTSVLAAITGLVLLFRLLLKTYSQPVSLLTVVSIAFATNLFFYGSLDPVNSHALSFLAAVLFLIFLLQHNWFLTGLSLGFIGLVRPQDLIYVLAIVPYRKTFKTIFITGFLFVISVQLLIWQIQFGKFWLNPYLLNESFSFWRPQILPVLFSYRNGLFFWTPILLLGLIGLWKSKITVWLKIVVLVQIFLVSTWSTWWQGASYSGRMFVSSLPILAFGLAHVYEWLWEKGWREFYFWYIFIAPLSLLNMLFIVYFLLIT